MDWVLLAVAASVVSAVQTELNHHFKVESNLLVFWRSIFGLLLITPLMFVFPVPQSGLFYAIALLSGLMTTFSDKLYYNAARQFGGRLAVMYMPVKIISVFVLWALIDPASIEDLIQKPWHFAVVLGCFVLSFVSLLIMRQNDASWKAFLYVLPVGLVLTLSDVAAKLALQDGVSVWGGVLMFTLMMLAANAAITSLILWWNPPPRQAFKDSCLPSFYICLAFCLMVALFISSIHLTPNPGYTSALALLAVVWLMLYNRLRGKPDGNPLSALMLIVAAAGIVLMV